MQGLKEKGRKLVSNDAFTNDAFSNDAFTTITDICMAGWQRLPPSHTNICKFDLLQNEYLLQFSTFSPHICSFYQMNQSFNFLFFLLPS